MNRMVRVVAGLILLMAMAVSSHAQAGGGAAGGAGGARDAFAMAKPILEQQQKGALIRLDAGVDDVMLRSIRRRVDAAGKAGCSVLIFEVSTFGGQVTSAIEISQYIKKLTTEKFITVAWVNPKAYSAGAMITAACQHVVMAGEGQYGDCAPIAVATTLTGGRELVPVGEAERAKLESPVIAEFKDSAKKNGWSEDALLAMVVVQDQLHEMRNKTTGDTVYVGDKKKAELLAVETPGPGGANAPKIRPWEYVRTVDDDKSLLTVSADQAVKMGLSQATIDNEQQLKDLCNIRGEMMIMNFNWAERATVFLTDWYIRGLLFVGLIVFGLLEFSHPGVTIFGVAAVICLVLLIGAPFLTGLAQIWEIALIVVGVAIIIADLLAFGGIGIIALPGFILMAIGLVASFVPADANGFMTTQSAWRAAQTGLGVVVGGTFLAVGAFWLLAKYLQFTPGFNRLQLVPGGGRGGAAALAVAGVGAVPEVRDAADREASDAVFVGAIGRAATDLRPAGKARFGEHLVGVVSYGSFIEKETEVEVLEVSGMRIVVKPRVAPAAGEGMPPTAQS
jgi:membrane-bound serine protease (ClpP class)